MVTTTTAATSVAVAVMLLRFHIYLFNCAINVRAYVSACARAMKKRNGKMIVKAVDDEANIE